MNAKTSASILGLILPLSFTLHASDWPQYRGPNHDGSSSEKILAKWPADGLHTVWKVPLKNGFSSMTVGGGKVFTLVDREVDGALQEVCVAMDAKTGAELWAQPLGVAKFDQGGDRGAPGNDGGDGPRSTPTYDNGKVYTSSSRLVVQCFDAATGKQIWSCDLIKEHAGRNIHWENAASPLVDDGLVFVAGGGPGEALIAFDKNSGKLIWKSQDDTMTQSTPVVAEILGARQVIFYTQNGLVAVAPKTGEVLWRFQFRMSRGAAGTSPVVSGDTVYYSAAYGVGAVACKISRDGDKFAATKLWSSQATQNQWSTAVTSGGYVYGIHGQAIFGSAPLQCVELATGKIVWSKEGFGPGGCNLVDGHVMVLSDAGDLVLVKASPDAYTEEARSHILAGKCWNSVGISDGRVFARSTKEGVCVDVAP